MPYFEKSLSISDLTIAGQTFDVGLGAGLGWRDVGFLDFLAGNADPVTSEISKTETGLHIITPSLNVGGRELVGPELNLDIDLPNPKLPYTVFEEELGSIEHGGQVYSWGIRGFAGWEDTTLLEMINVDALLDGDVNPIPPDIGFEFFVDEFVIDDLRIIPPEVRITPPEIWLTLFGKPLKLAYGDEIVVTAPSELDDYIDADADPLALTIPELNLDQLLSPTKVAQYPSDYWKDALTIDVRNPELPYFETFLAAGSFEIDGRDWDIGLDVSVGWENQRLFDMLAGDLPVSGIEFGQTGFVLQSPGIDVAGFSLAGPALGIDLVLPDLDLPFYSFSDVVAEFEIPGTGGETVGLGINAELGWKDATLMDLVDVGAWIEGSFESAEPVYDYSFFLEYTDDNGSTVGAVPDVISLALPQARASVFGKNVLFGVGSGPVEISLTDVLGDDFGGLIDASMDPIEIVAPSIDLNSLVDLDPRTYQPDGSEILINVLDTSSFESAFFELIKVVPGNYGFTDSPLVAAIDVLADELIPFSLTSFSIDDLMPTEAYEKIKWFVDEGAETVDLTIPSQVYDIPGIGLFLSNPILPNIEQSLDATTIELAGEMWDIGLSASLGWQGARLIDVLAGEAPASGLSALDTGFGIQFQPEGINLAGFNLQAPSLQVDLRLPDPDLPFIEFDQTIAEIDIPASNGAKIGVGASARIGWEDTSLLNLIDLDALLNGEFSAVAPEFEIDLRLEYTDSEGMGSSFLPGEIHLALPDVKLELMDKTLLLGFGSRPIEFETSRLGISSGFIDESLEPLLIDLPTLDLNRLIDPTADLSLLTDLSDQTFYYQVQGSEIEVDVTDLDSLEAGFRRLIQVLPSEFSITNPTATGELLGLAIDTELPLLELSGSLQGSGLIDFNLSSFGLEDVLTSDIFEWVQPLIDPEASPVTVNIPDFDFGTLGSPIPVLDQFLEQIEFLPSELRVYDPSLIAQVTFELSELLSEQPGMSLVTSVLPLPTSFDSTIDQEVSVSGLVSDALSRLGIDYLRFGSDETGTYMAFNVIDVLPESVADILGIFVDLDDPEIRSFEIPSFSFGTIDINALIGGDRSSASTQAASSSQTQTVTTTTTEQTTEAPVNEDWVALDSVTNARSGQSEIQKLTLDTKDVDFSTGSIGASLGLGRMITDPIEILELGESRDAIQAVSLLSAYDLVGHSVPASSYELTLSHGRQPVGSNEKFRFYFEGDPDVQSKTARFLSTQTSRQPDEVVTALADLLGIQGTAERVSRGVYTLGGITAAYTSNAPANNQRISITFSDTLAERLDGVGELKVTMITPGSNLRPSLEALDGSDLPPATFAYSVSLGGQKTKADFIAPSSRSLADIETATESNRASLEKALEDLVGSGNVSVGTDYGSEDAWLFVVTFQGQLAGQQVGLVSVEASGAADGSLLVDSAHLVEGRRATDATMQAALIEAGLNDAFGGTVARVDVSDNSAVDAVVYEIRYTDQLGDLDLPQIRNTSPVDGLVVTVDTEVNGSAASGPRFVLDQASVEDASSFDVRVSVNGAQYIASALDSDISADALASAIKGSEYLWVTELETGEMIEEIFRFSDLGLDPLVTQASSADGGQGYIITFAGDVSNYPLDGIEIRLSGSVPEQSDPASQSPDRDASAVGGIVARNDIRSTSVSGILNSSVSASGISISSTDNGIVRATLDATAEAAGSEGDGMAVGGIISANIVQGGASAVIENSRVTSQGDVSINSINSAHIDATNNSAVTAGETSVGATLAFNTVGYEASNILAQAADALAGAGFAVKNPNHTIARIVGSEITASGGLVVDARSEAYIRANVDNEAVSSAAAAEGKSKGGVSAGFVLSSNFIAGDTRALVDNDGNTLSAGLPGLTVSAVDDAAIDSQINLTSAVEAGGLGLGDAARSIMDYIGITYTDHSGIQRLKVGDRVRLGSAEYGELDSPTEIQTGERVTLQTNIGNGAAGQTYEYLGQDLLTNARFAEQDFSDTSLWRRLLGDPGMVYVYTGPGEALDLSQTDYTDTSRWTALDLQGFVELGLDVLDSIGAEDGSTAVGGLITRNSLDGFTSAKVLNSDIVSQGDVVVEATRSGRVVAADNSDVSAGGTGLGLVVATNNLLGGTWSELAGSSVSTVVAGASGGDLRVRSVNDALISATVASKVKAKTSVGITLAFNSIGYLNTNLLDDLAALVTRADNVEPGQAFATESWVSDSSLNLSGSLVLNSDSAATIDAVIKSSALSVDVDKDKSNKSAISIAPVAALNRIASTTVSQLAGSHDLTVGGDLTIDGTNRSRIQAEVSASSIALSAGKTGSKSVSIGISLSRNEIDSLTDAGITGEPGNRPIISILDGALSIHTTREASIVANGSASSVAVSASPKGGPSVGGGGTLALNRISGTSDAGIDDAVVELLGTADVGHLTVRSDDQSKIDAQLRTTAVSVSAGKSGKAVALGFSAARNIIGAGPQSDLAFDLRSSDYGSENRLSALSTGTRVLADTGLLSGAVFEYIGPYVEPKSDDEDGEDGLDLTTVDFHDADRWRELTYLATDSNARVVVADSELTAPGDVVFDSTSSAQINARVQSLSAAVGAGAGGSGLSASAAGVLAHNLITSGSEVRVLGAGSSMVDAATIAISSDNAASIDAVAGAAALGASLGVGGTGASVAVGLSIALNEIDSDSLAIVEGVDLRASSGDLTVEAKASGIPVLEDLTWDEMVAAGLDASALDALAKPADLIDLMSNDGREWDFLETDGVVQIEDGMKVLRANGDIYEYDDDDGPINLSATDFSDGSLWDIVDRPTIDLENGYRVRVDLEHSSGGLAGRVYRFVGPEEDDVELSSENYADGSRWVLDDEYADPADERRLVEVLAGAGLEIPRAESILPSATYSSDYDNHWDFTNEDGEQDIEDGDLIGDTVSGSIYRYTGPDENEFDLGDADFSDSDLWEEVIVRADHVVTDPFRSVTTGDLLVASPGGYIGVFEFLGTTSRMNLASVDYGDTSNWASVSWHDGRLGRDLSIETDDVLLVAGDNGQIEAHQYKGTSSDIVWSQVDLSDGSQWQQRSVHLVPNGSDSEVTTGQVVQITMDGGTRMLRYLGETAVVSLATQDYTDTSLWESFDGGTQLTKGDTVSLAEDHSAGGLAGLTYEYIGRNYDRMDLSNTDFGDTNSWSLVVPKLTVGVIESGRRWSVTDADGTGYTISVQEGRLSVQQNSINSTAVAASAAIGLSVGGSGLALSGAGAVATNKISSSVDALVVDAVVETSQDLSVLALSNQSIASTIVSASAALAASAGGAGLGASIGVSIARNYIGTDTFQLSDQAGSATIRAMIVNGDMNAAGEIFVGAYSQQTIHANVVAVSAAIAASSGFGGAASGSGSVAENAIATQIHAGLSGSVGALQPPSGLMVDAADDSRITANVSAASLAAAVSGGTGVALSVGVSLARNMIGTSLESVVSDSDLEVAGDITISARSEAVINARASAASVAAALSAGTGIGISGAGASAMNIIVARSVSDIVRSGVVLAGNLAVESLAKGVIDARIISASLGAGAGAGVGVGASVGVSIARNYLGYNPYSGVPEDADFVYGIDQPARITAGQTVYLPSGSGTRAGELYRYIGEEELTPEDKDDDDVLDDLLQTQDYDDKDLWEQIVVEQDNLVAARIRSTDIVAGVANDASGGMVMVDATNTQIIVSEVTSGSAAASVGGSVGAALSGAGGSSTNRIGTQTMALIDGVVDDLIDATGDVNISALDQSAIVTQVEALSVAAAFGGIAGALAVGVARADSLIGSEVVAQLDQAGIAAEGSISITSEDQSTILTDASATAVAIAGGKISLAFAGGGASSLATIETGVFAGSTGGTDLALLVGLEGVEISAVSASTVDNDAGAAAASFGLIGAAAAGTVAETTLAGQTTAMVDKSRVRTGDSGRIAILADGSQTADNYVATFSVSSGGALGSSAVTSNNFSTVFAAIGDQSQIRGGEVLVNAVGNDSLYADSVAASGGLFVGIAGAEAVMNVFSDVGVAVGESVDIQAGRVELYSSKRQGFDTRSSNVAVGAVSGTGASVVNVVSGLSEVSVGSGTTIRAGDVFVRAESDADKTRFGRLGTNLESGTAGIASLSKLAAESSFGLYGDGYGSNVDIGDGVTIEVSSESGLAGGVLRIETENIAELYDKSAVEGVSAVGISLAEASQTGALRSTISVGSGASLRNLSGDVTLSTRTELDNIASATVETASLIAGANSKAYSTFVSDNSIRLDNAEVVGRDVLIMSGRGMMGGFDKMLGHHDSRAMANLSVFGLGAALPLEQVSLTEFNDIVIDGSSTVKAVRSIDLLADSSQNQARKDGSQVVLPVPVVVDVLGDPVLVENHRVLLSDDAVIEAGINYATSFVIEPYYLGGAINLTGTAEADREARLLEVMTSPDGVALSDAEKTALGLNIDVEFEYQALVLDSIAPGISGGAIVELVGSDYGRGESGEYYRFNGGRESYEALTLETEDYTDTLRWTKISPHIDLGATTEGIVTTQSGDLLRARDGRWFERVGPTAEVDTGSLTLDTENGWAELEYMTSDAGRRMAADISNDFYVIKPADVAMPSLIYENLTSGLVADRLAVQDWITNHSGNTELVARYTELLTQIDRQLENLGLAERQFTDSGDEVVVITKSVERFVLDLPTIEASAGLVFVSADELSRAEFEAVTADGRVVAHGSPEIQILNRTPISMRVNDVGITGADRVIPIDGELRTLAAGAAYFNGDTVGAANSVSSGQITVRQDGYPSQVYGDQGALGALVGTLDGPIDLNVEGRLVNEDGAITVANLDGSVNVTGELRASTLNLSATGDFNLQNDNWFHTGGDPRQMLGDTLVAALRGEVYRADGSYSETTAAEGSALADQVAGLMGSDAVGRKSGGGEIVTLGAVDINARFVNINGLIQSGVDTYEIFIDETFDPTESGNLTDSEGQPLDGVSFGPTGYQSVGAFFDKASGQIVIDDISPTAGRISISGAILSTGGGELRVASGYADVNLVNRSRFGLAVGEIDNSENRVGRVTLHDTQTLKREEIVFEDGVATRTVQQGVVDDSPILGVEPQITAVRTTGGSSPAGEEVSNLLDGDPATKYLNYDGPGSGIILDMAAPVALNSVTVTREDLFDADTAGWDPATFSVYGSDAMAPGSDDPSWVKIGEGQWSLDDLPSASSRAEFDNETSYLTYKLVFDETKQDLRGLDLSAVSALATELGYPDLSEPELITLAELLLERDNYIHIADLSVDVARNNSVSYTTVDALALEQPADQQLTFEPTDGQYYVWVEGQESTTKTIKTYVTREAGLFIKFDALARDRVEPDQVDGPVLLDDAPLLESEFIAIADELGIAGEPVFNLEFYANTVTDVIRGNPVVIKDTWFVTETEVKDTYVEGRKDFYTYALRADLPVLIATDYVADQPEIKIETPAGLSLSGDITLGIANPDAVLAPGEVFRPIAFDATAIEIADDVMFTGAVPDLSVTGDVVITLRDIDPRSLINILATGDVTILSPKNPAVDDLTGGGALRVGQIVTGQIDDTGLPTGGDFGDVVIDSYYGIQQAPGGNSRIIAGTVELYADRGNVDVTVDTAADGTGGVVAQASGNISITEARGDLLLISPDGDSPSISTSTDVYLTTLDGSVIDAIEERPAGRVSRELEAALLPHSVVDAGTVTERVNVRARNLTIQSDADVGTVLGLTTIESPFGGRSLSDTELQVMSLATADDIAATHYRQYEYLGPTATYDLSVEGMFGNSGLWRAVSASASDLSTEDGMSEVITGQIVEDRRDLVSVTLRTRDAVDIDLSGSLAVSAAGHAALTSTGSLLVETGQKAVQGVTVSGDLYLGSGQDITVNTSETSSHALVSGGSMSLRAAGDIAGAFVTGAYEALTVGAAGSFYATAGGDAYLAALSGDLTVGRIEAAGLVSVSVSGGQILDSVATGDTGRSRLVGTELWLALSDATGSVGSSASPLVIDTERLRLEVSQAGIAQDVVIENGGDLILDALESDKLGLIKLGALGDLTFAADSVMTTGNGRLVLDALSGDLILSGDLNVGRSDLELNATGDLVQKSGSTVRSSDGLVSVVTGSGFTQAAGAEILTTGLDSEIDLDIGSGVVLARAVADTIKINARSGDISSTLGSSGVVIDAEGTLSLSATGSVGTTGLSGGALNLAAGLLDIDTGSDVSVRGHGDLVVGSFVLSGQDVSVSVTTQASDTKDGDLGLSADIALGQTAAVYLGAAGDLFVTSSRSVDLGDGVATLDAGGMIVLGDASSITAADDLSLEAVGTSRWVPVASSRPQGTFCRSRQREHSW